MKNPRGGGEVVWCVCRVVGLLAVIEGEPVPVAACLLGASGRRLMRCEERAPLICIHSHPNGFSLRLTDRLKMYVFTKAFI